MTRASRLQPRVDVVMRCPRSILGLLALLITVTFDEGCTEETMVDTDGDDYPDHLDLDSDNDGIPDAIEACGDISLVLEECMLDNNGSAFYPDLDDNGCPEGIVNGACATPIDTDGDGFPDFRDLDSDGDAQGEATSWHRA